MRTLCLVLVGVVVGWAASGFDWSREAVGEEEMSLITGEKLEAIWRDGVSEQHGKIHLIRENAAGDLGDENGHELLARGWYRSVQAAPSDTPMPNAYRYQFSAVGTSAVDCAYYVFDAQTGRVWFGNQGMKAKLIADVGGKTE